jgi:HEAT repeat protein
VNVNDALPGFGEVLDLLLEESEDIPVAYLNEFSDIEPDALDSLLEVWPNIPLDRKQLLLDRLNALADVDTLVSFDDLGRALLKDPAAPVRVRAMRLLVECNDARLIPNYLDILKSDEDVSARAEAATALGLFVQLGEFDDIPLQAHREVEEALLAVLGQEDEVAVQRRALESLGYSSRPEVSVLIESAIKRQDPDWKGSALFAMGRSGDEAWGEYVLQTIPSVYDNMRLAAVGAAGELKLKAALPLLFTLLEEEDNETVAGAAIWSLSQIGGDDARVYLESLLDLAEEEDQIAFLEEALDNLAFTDDMDRFDLMALDADDSLNAIDALDDPDA